MTSLSSTVSLGRALLSLERTRATGVMRVTTNAGESRLSIRHGRIVAAVGLCEPDLYLSELSVDMAELDPDWSALHKGGQPERWLRADPLPRVPTRNGLRRQVSYLLTRARIDYRFTNRPLPNEDVFLHRHPPTMADVVLCGLRRALGGHKDRVPDPSMTAPARLTLTDVGHQLLERAPLWPEEQAAAVLLRGHMGRTARLPVPLLGKARVRQLLSALRLIGGLRTASSPDRTSYTLLLCKHRQVQRNDDPFALLGIPRGAAPSDARRALRRLAQQLHPDRVFASEESALQSISCAVMRALLSAEESIRKAGPHRLG